MSITQSAKFLRTVLLTDAATCLATGLLMTLGADIVAGLTAVPAPVLLYAGFSLFPLAIFISLVGTRQTPASPAGLGGFLRHPLLGGGRAPPPFRRLDPPQSLRPLLL